MFISVHSQVRLHVACVVCAVHLAYLTHKKGFRRRLDHEVFLLVFLQEFLRGKPITAVGAGVGTGVKPANVGGQTACVACNKAAKVWEDNSYERDGGDDSDSDSDDE